MNDGRLEVALSYAARGWHVFPCHVARNGRCSCGRTPEEHERDGITGFGKHPRTEHGFKDATTDLATIRAWWARWPDANIGIACGASELDVLDCDPQHGGDESLRDLYQEIGRDAFQTVTCETGGGGMHLYYRVNGHSLGNSEGKLAEGLDTRGVGGYVIAPPSVHPSGRVYQWAMNCGPTECPLLDVPEPLAQRLQDHRREPTGTVGDTIPSGQRNGTLTSLAGTMRRRGMGEAAILAALLEENAARCRPPLSDAEVRSIAASVAHYEPAADTPLPEHCTDLGNARRLVALHGADLRYCGELGGWLIYDGRRWTPDRSGQVERYAKDTARAIYGEAANAPDEAERKALAKWALASESALRLRAMIELARSEPGVPVRADDFDRDPWLLNVQNGALDLHTGQVAPHRREDMITKLCPVDYDPRAEDEKLKGYLAVVTAGNNEFASYLQRCAGYSLTGLTDDEVILLVLGPSATGKSTLIEALLALLGDYAVKLPFDSFLERRDVGAPRPDLTRLRGARLVAAVETAKTRTLDGVLLKELTGGDTITVRSLYALPFSFRPECKVWLAANDAPRIDDCDSGIWRRLQRLPFEAEIQPDQRDPQIKKHLRTDGLSALLAWAVVGCLAWQKDGLQPCATVKTRTAELRASMNPLLEFVEERCLLGGQYKTEGAELRAAYEMWAAEVRAKPLSNRVWGSHLRALGCERNQVREGGKNRRYWSGVGLLDKNVAECSRQTPFSEKSPMESETKTLFQKAGLSATSATDQGADDLSGYEREMLDRGESETP